ncbi:MAG: hypothetical protein MUE53_02995 [Chitinophagales bacterium]|nr:hypothetical protein [Chitinophagales bacterium]
MKLKKPIFVLFVLCLQIKAYIVAQEYMIIGSYHAEQKKKNQKPTYFQQIDFDELGYVRINQKTLGNYYVFARDVYVILPKMTLNFKLGDNFLIYLPNPQNLDPKSAQILYLDTTKKSPLLHEKDFGFTLYFPYKPDEPVNPEDTLKFSYQSGMFQLSTEKVFKIIRDYQDSVGFYFNAFTRNFDTSQIDVILTKNQPFAFKNIYIALYDRVKLLEYKYKQSLNQSDVNLRNVAERNYLEAVIMLSNTMHIEGFAMLAKHYHDKNNVAQSARFLRLAKLYGYDEIEMLQEALK